MATRSKPQTSFYLKYGVVTPTNTADSLTPVFIAPRYVVHATAYDNNSTGVVYDGTSTGVIRFPDQLLDVAGISGAIIDSSADHVSVYISDPVVKLGSSGAVATGVSGTIGAGGSSVEFAGAITGNNQTVFYNNYNLQVGDQLINGGSSAYITEFAQTSGAYVSAVLDGAIGTSGGAATVFVNTSNFISGPVAVESGSYAISATGVNVKANAKFAYKNDDIPITSGGVLINYRELRTDDVNEVIAASDAGISDWVGALEPENPLGMLYNAGIQTGYDNFYLVATASESDNDYNTALDAAGKVEAAYALYPLNQSTLVINHAKSIVAHYSAPNIAQMKRLWIYSQLQQGTMTRTQYAKAIANEAKAYGNHRINYIYAGPNTVAGYDFDDARYVVPVLMAMRGAMAPHAPLTDVPIPGVAFGADPAGFTDSDYDEMNNGGVWVCYRDSRGESVSRHAITTGGVGTIAEEDSAVSNGDNILRFVRTQISFLRGNCNVTPALIDKIYTNVMHALDAILRRNYDALIGPQIVTIESVDIQQDPNNTAGVIGTINLDLPDVYLDGQFTFNLF